MAALPLAAVDQPKDLFLAHRYDSAHVLISLAAVRNEDISFTEGARLPPPAAGFIQDRELYDIEPARLQQLALDRPIDVRVGDRYEVVPGPRAAMKATVEKFTILNSCGFSVMAMLRVNQVFSADEQGD
jgi:hypothetical protein